MTNGSPDKLKPALIGGAVAGVLSATSVVPCVGCFVCCAASIGGGVLAAYLYIKDAPPTAEAPLGDGALVGLMAGVVAALMATVIGAVIQLIGWTGVDPAQLEEAFDQMGDEVPQAFKDFLSSMATGGVSAIAIVISLVVNLVVYSVVCTLGGVLGAAILHKKATPPPPVAPPPPATEV